MYPQARSEDLVVEPIGEELLVFDGQAHRAHSLNVSAAAVWRACDGTRDPDALAAHTGLEPDMVNLALQNLADCQLLTHIPDQDGAPRVSRRIAIRKAALTGAGIGLAIPVIRSIAAPNPAAAASTCVAAAQACSAQNCCSFAHQQVACTGSGKCSRYDSSTVSAGQGCGQNYHCRFPNHCVNNVCQ